ncbi:hypothetical protein ANO11243_078200 [Dothideomycetidae sp. 11243]|nr:hypothetical protein ANO11243_078200 [fungal sp. No.11243]
MGKPRMIILIRHAQSEGNQNRDVHQIIPDHRIKLTEEGQKQAADAGRRLRAMLRPDDTIRLYTSPYRRTRETTEGLLSTLTEATEESGPSPFSRDTIIVREEPRLREQDFGNFQPCSAEMERMWQERADYGHFFYRIQNGESAADAYDRISGFNDSLWRSFEEDSFPSVLILVTHGLMTRVFLMRWFHYSVEKFEDLRNINHCEFVIMNRSLDTGRFVLENKLRTWSELKRRATLSNKDRRQSSTQVNPAPRQWGGCVDGCNHGGVRLPRRQRPVTGSPDLSANQQTRKTSDAVAEANGAIIATEKSANGSAKTEAVGQSTGEVDKSHTHVPPPLSISAADSETVAESAPDSKKLSDGRPLPLPLRQDRLHLSQFSPLPLRSPFTAHLRGRDAGGSESGMPTPDTDHFSTEQSDAESNSSTSDVRPAKSAEYFPVAVTRELHRLAPENRIHSQNRKRRERPSRTLARTFSEQDVSPASPPEQPVTEDSASVSPTAMEAPDWQNFPPDRRPSERKLLRSAAPRLPRRRTTREDMEKWMAQSGMGRGVRADALGDAEEVDSDDDEESGAEGSTMDDGRMLQVETQPATLAEVKNAEEQDRSLTGSVY